MKCHQNFDFLKLCIEHQPCHPRALEAKKRSLRPPVKRNKEFDCSYCEYSNQHFQHLSNHLRRVHDLTQEQLHVEIRKKFGDSSRRNFVFCNDCSFAINDKGKMALHIRDQHSLVRCTICRQNFTYRGSLAHRQICGIPVFYECTQCSYIAKAKSYLKRHVHTVHAERSQVICPDCGRTYKSVPLMRRHRKNNVCPKKASTKN